MASLSRRLEGAGLATACHFHRAGDVARQDPVRAIQSLAYSLALALPQLQQQYLDLEPHALSQLASADDAFALLIQEPLQRLQEGLAKQVAGGQQAGGSSSAPGPSPSSSHLSLTLAIDGVDEAQGQLGILSQIFDGPLRDGLVKRQQTCGNEHFRQARHPRGVQVSTTYQTQMLTPPQDAH